MFFRRLKTTKTAADFDEISLLGERSVERDRTAETLDIGANLWGYVQDLAENG